MRSRELLDNNFGTMLVQNIGRDLAGEVVRRYFDMSDYYITVSIPMRVSEKLIITTLMG